MSDYGVKVVNKYIDDAIKLLNERHPIVGIEGNQSWNATDRQVLDVAMMLCVAEKPV